MDRCVGSDGAEYSPRAVEHRKIAGQRRSLKNAIQGPAGTVSIALVCEGGGRESARMKSAICFAGATLVCMAMILRAQTPALPQTAAAADAPKPAESKTEAKPDAQAEITALHSACEAAKAGGAAEREKWLAALRTWYTQELTKLLASQVKLGGLEGAVAAKAEQERIAAGAEPTRAEIDAMPEPLRKLRANYDAGLKRIRDEVARRNDAANRKLLADLEALQKHFTVSSLLDDALAVRVEKDRIAAEMTKSAAAAERPGETPGPAAPPAAAATPSEPDKPAQPPSGPAADILGTWRFTYVKNGWSATRTLKADGSFTGERFKGAGKWEVNGSKAILTYPNGLQDLLMLPADPKHARVHDNKGRDLLAVKEDQ